MKSLLRKDSEKKQSEIPVSAALLNICVSLMKFLNSVNMDFSILEEEMQILLRVVLELNELRQNRF